MKIDSTPRPKSLTPLRTNFADPADVLDFLRVQLSTGQACALIVVTDTQGGGVRAPGALAGVSADQSCAGYVSNGCVDADMFAQALAAIADDKPRAVRYGAGSPYRDIALPCGGAVELLIVPNPPLEIIKQLSRALTDRESVGLSVSIAQGVQSVDCHNTGWQGEAFHVRCNPKLRLRIVGRGTEPIALMRAAHALDFDVVLQSPDLGPLEAARALGYEGQHLHSPSDPPHCDDDAHTACVMMFHDHDWEPKLLIEALKGEAFYIGALGGRKTHASRREALLSAGASPRALERIKGPIGLIPSVRNASYLAVSVLAEIIDAYETVRQSQS